MIIVDNQSFRIKKRKQALHALRAATLDSKKFANPCCRVAAAGAKTLKEAMRHWDCYVKTDKDDRIVGISECQGYMGKGSSTANMLGAIAPFVVPGSYFVLGEQTYRFDGDHLTIE